MKREAQEEKKTAAFFSIVLQGAVATGILPFHAPSLPPGIVVRTGKECECSRSSCSFPLSYRADAARPADEEVTEPSSRTVVDSVWHVETKCRKYIPLTRRRSCETPSDGSLIAYGALGNVKRRVVGRSVPIHKQRRFQRSPPVCHTNTLSTGSTNHTVASFVSTLKKTPHLGGCSEEAFRTAIGQFVFPAFCSCVQREIKERKIFSCDYSISLERTFSCRALDERQPVGHK